MEVRRSLLMMHKFDTSPVIENDGFWTRTFGVKSLSPGWGITKFYNINDQVDGSSRRTYINGYVGADTSSITFQYYLSDGSTDWWYFAGTNPRCVINPPKDLRITKISFSIELSEADDSYAYIMETGQIIFAGKNTIYYGYKNINDMPYQPVEYLESTGTQYIDLNHNPTQQFHAIMDFTSNKQVEETFESLMGAQNMTTAYNNNAVRYSAIIVSTNTLVRIVAVPPLGQEYDIDANDSTFFNSRRLYDFNFGTGMFTIDNLRLALDPIQKASSYSMYILARNNTGTATNFAKGLLYGLECFDDNYHINLIPCIRKSDSKPGMYDMVSKTFYTNAGTGEFIIPE